MFFKYGTMFCLLGIFLQVINVQYEIGFYFMLFGIILFVFEFVGDIFSRMD